MKISNIIKCEMIEKLFAIVCNVRKRHILTESIFMKLNNCDSFIKHNLASVILCFYIYVDCV